MASLGATLGVTALSQVAESAVVRPSPFKGDVPQGKFEVQQATDDDWLPPLPPPPMQPAEVFELVNKLPEPELEAEDGEPSLASDAPPAPSSERADDLLLHYEVQTFPNEHYLTLHLRDLVPYMGHFGTKRKDPSYTVFGDRLQRKLAAIRGVDEVTGGFGGRYQVNITKGKMFNWAELMPSVEAVLLAAYSRVGVVRGSEAERLFTKLHDMVVVQRASREGLRTVHPVALPPREPEDMWGDLDSLKPQRRGKWSKDVYGRT